MLQKSYTSVYGSTHSTAVHAVCTISLDNIGLSAAIGLATWVTDAARIAGSVPIRPCEVYNVSGSDFTTYFDEAVLELVGETPTTKAYEYLLTLPEFTGAVVI